MSMDKYAGLMASSARAMADSARSIEMLANVMESQMETQNALLTTLVDKLDKVASSKSAPAAVKDSDGAGGGGRGLSALIGGMARDGKAAAEGMEKFNEVAKDFKKSIKHVASAMNFWDEAVSDDTTEKFTDSLSKLAKKFGEIDFKPIKEGGESLDLMSKSIAVFGLTLMVASIAYAIIGPMAAITIIPTIAGFSWVFAKIGQASESIEDGARAIGIMGLAIASMGLAMFVAGQLAGGSLADFAKGALIITAGIALFGIVFHLIGSMENNIEAGAKSLVWAGLAVASLGIGMWVWNELGIQFKSVLIAAAGVAAIGIAFGLVGVFANYVESGAMALLWSGISIATLGLSIWAFSQLVEWENLAIVGASILEVGLLFGLAGVFAIPIALGALAIFAAGAAMIVLAGGVWILGKVYEESMDGLFAKSDIDPTKSNLNVMISSIVEAFSINPVDSVFMFLGGVALISASVAMIILSAGIWALGRHADSALWDKSDMNPDSSKLEVMIDAVVDSFSINPLRSVAMLVGGAAIMVTSIAMIILAAGIWAVARHVDSALWEESEITPAWADGSMTKLNLMVGSVVDAFSINPFKSVAMMVGSAALILSSITMMIMAPGISLLSRAFEKGSSLFETSDHDKEKTNLGLIFGSISDSMSLGIFQMARLYASIPAWLLVGKSIRDIGKGVADFIKIYEAGIDPKTLTEALKAVLSSVVESIINSDKDTDWDAVEDGLEAIRDVGSSVSGIADGVQKFAELKFPVYNAKGEVVKYLTLNDGVFDNVATNMKLLIGAVANTLTEVGRSQGETGWFSKTDGEKGAEIIRGIGGDLVDIADFVVKAADLRMPVYDENGNLIEGQTTEITPDMLGPEGKVSMNIMNMISAITNALAVIGKDPDADQGFWSGKSTIDKGKEAIMGVGKDLKDLSEVVVNLSQVENMDAVKSRMEQMLGVVPNVILKVAPQYEKAKSQKDTVVSVLRDMNEPLSALVETLKSAEQANITGTTGDNLGLSIASLFNHISDAVSVDVLDIDRLVPVSEFVADLASHDKPIDSLAKSFGKLAADMNKFVKAYKAMDQKSIAKHKDLIDSLVVFSKVDPGKLQGVSKQGRFLLDEINSGKVGQSTPAATAAGPAVQSGPQKPDQKGTKPVDPKKSQVDMAEVIQGLQELNANITTLKNSLLMATLKVKVQGGI
jgi:hypothetical protein